MPDHAVSIGDHAQHLDCVPVPGQADSVWDQDQYLAGKVVPGQADSVLNKSVASQVFLVLALLRKDLSVLDL